MFFLVCERNFEWCRVHGEGVKGPHMLIFFRIPENYRTSRMSSYSMDLTVYILGVCFKSADISIVVLKEWLCFWAGTCAVACARREQRLANIMKPTFQLNVSFASLRNFRVIFWHGI